MYLIATFLGYLFKGFLLGTEVIRTGQEVELWRSYISGVTLLGIAPCTAMVLMWSYLAKSNDSLYLGYGCHKFSDNVCTLCTSEGFLLSVNSMPIPWKTILFSVMIYVVLSLIAGCFSRKWIIKSRVRMV